MSMDLYKVKFLEIFPSFQKEVLLLSIFIGSIPTIIALGDDSVNGRKEISQTASLFQTIVPSNQIFIDTLASYSILYLFFLFCCYITRNRCNFFLIILNKMKPIADFLYYTLGVISGVFFIFSLVAISESRWLFICNLVSTFFVFYFAVVGLTLNYILGNCFNHNK